MPALSKSQQRLFGMIHAIQTGKLNKKKVSKNVRNMAKKIDPESVEHFATTKHSDLPEKKSSYASGTGIVESYTRNKTKDHDEIVIRLKNGKTLRISNNIALGNIVEPKTGDRINYHGYTVDGTNVIHKVHSNKNQRGGWLEHIRNLLENQ